MSKQRGNATAKAMAILLFSIAIGTAAGYRLTSSAYQTSGAANNEIEVRINE